MHAPYSSQTVRVTTRRPKPLCTPPGHTASSSYESRNESWDIAYGSGAAQGVLGEDIVQFAGFEVKNQTFGERPHLPVQSLS